MNKLVLLYEDLHGRSPFEDWLNTLPDEVGAAKIRMRLDRARFGNLGNHRSVGHGVVELKVSFGPGYRIYIGQSGERIILLRGGDKSTQSKDVHQAQRDWAEFRSRK